MNSLFLYDKLTSSESARYRQLLSRKLALDVAIQALEVYAAPPDDLFEEVEFDSSSERSTQSPPIDGAQGANNTAFQLAENFVPRKENEMAEGM